MDSKWRISKMKSCSYQWEISNSLARLVADIWINHTARYELMSIKWFSSNRNRVINTDMMWMNEYPTFDVKSSNSMLYVLCLYDDAQRLHVIVDIFDVKMKHSVVRLRLEEGISSRSTACPSLWLALTSVRLSNIPNQLRKQWRLRIIPT